MKNISNKFHKGTLTMIIFLAEKLVGPRCVQIASKRQQNLYVLFARLIHSNLYSDLQRVPVMAQQFGSVSCERSFSALRRLKLWTRFSMTEERRSGLARMLIHRRTRHAKRQRIFMNENQSGDIFYRLVSQTSCSIVKCLV